MMMTDIFKKPATWGAIAFIAQYLGVCFATNSWWWDAFSVEAKMMIMAVIFYPTVMVVIWLEVTE